jgi:hypothetical protein
MKRKRRGKISFWGKNQRGPFPRRRRRWPRSTPLWIGVLLFAALYSAGTLDFSSPAETSGKTTTATGASVVRASFGMCQGGGGYNCVVDGDTIWLEGENIRILDIDAPETSFRERKKEARLRVFFPQMSSQHPIERYKAFVFG